MRLDSRLATVCILILLSMPIIINQIKPVDAQIRYSWKISTLSTGEFLSCFAHLYGSPFWEKQGLNFITVELENPTSQAVWRDVAVTVEGYTSVASTTVTVPAGSRKTLTFNPTFTDKIKQVTTPTPATVRITSRSSGGALAGEFTASITILPINYFVWGTNMSNLPYSIVLSTPHADPIQKILHLASKLTPWNAIIGYSPYPGMKNREVVETQMRAIYNVVKALGVTYVSTTETFSEVNAQRIKTPVQVLDDFSGNCIELTYLFDSILEAIGFRVVLIYAGNHILPAVREWSTSQNIISLESTALSRTFEEARRIGEDQYEKMQSLPRFQTIEVKQFRDQNVNPTPFMDVTASPRFETRMSALESLASQAESVMSKAKNEVEIIRNTNYMSPEADSYRKQAIQEYDSCVKSFLGAGFSEAKSYGEKALELASRAKSSEQQMRMNLYLAVAIIPVLIAAAWLVLRRRRTQKQKLQLPPPPP